MKVLVTGALGNIGTSTVEELIRQGHQVRCFDLRTRANERAARRFGEHAEVVWGDLRHADDLATAVRGQEIIVHLAFVIPTLSATGMGSEDRPRWAWEVNVGGTRNLLQAMKALPQPPKLIFTSSVHVFGQTQGQLPPRVVSDPVRPMDHYSRHKIECERMIKASGLDWAILRLAATFPLRLKLDPAMFDIPLDNRMEFVHTRDVGLAIANAVACPEVWGRIWLIGGGPECQFYYRDIVACVLGALGIGMLPEEAFGSTPFATDWMDTAESQGVLRYQQRTLEDYVQEMTSVLGYRRHFMRVFGPLVRYRLLRQSPYFRQARSRGKAQLEGAKAPF